MLDEEKKKNEAITPQGRPNPHLGPTPKKLVNSPIGIIITQELLPPKQCGIPYTTYPHQSTWGITIP
jgi:hypothetical protein